jgi:hypothetical protein
MLRHARYGPSDRYLEPPAAGMCMSVFAVVTRGRSVLIGRPKLHAAWRNKWLFSWATYSRKELQAACRENRLPSTYLLEGERPEDGLKRIMRDQLKMKSYSASGPRVFSYFEPSDGYPGNKHWDLAFVYDVKSRDRVRPLPWWEELRFLERDELRAEDFGWNSDFVQDIGLLTHRAKPKR